MEDGDDRKMQLVFRVYSHPEGRRGVRVGEATVSLHDMLDACSDLVHKSLSVMGTDGPMAGRSVGQLIVSLRGYDALDGVMHRVR